MRLNRSKLLFLLVSGIIILIVNFIIISCGRGPKQKTAGTDNGPFAIDFSRAPVGEDPNSGSPFKGVVFSETEPSPRIADEELTIEAWIKRRTDTLNGGVFARLDLSGIVLYVKDNMPKMAIRSIPTSTPTSTPTVLSSIDSIINPAQDPLKCSSSIIMLNNVPTEIKDCIVGSNFTLPKNDDNDDWTHVAGVLVDEAHTHTVTESCTNTVMSEKPHLDIYINGEFANCATAEETFSTEPGRFTSAGVIGEGNLPVLDDDPMEEDDEISTATRFDGAVDELRLWKVARTKEQITSCKDQELSFDGSGDCLINHKILNTYWRLNEGRGHDVKDFSGNGVNGGIEEGIPLHKWEDSWVDGAPIKKN
jgi:hypothetical protein